MVTDGPGVWIVLALALTRLPLLFHGYGSDDDAWRNIVAALHIRESGRYIPSRIPGFPLYEGILAVLAPGGPVLTNLASVTAGCAALALFAALLRDLRLSDRRWPWLALAFGPAVWVQSSQTMDYAFGFAFFLAAWRAALHRRWMLCGVLLALATGCRASYVLVLPAVALMLIASGASWWPALRFASTYLPLAAGLFVPVIAAPESRGIAGEFRHHAGLVSAATLFAAARSALVWLFGKFGLPVATGAIAATALTRRWRAHPGTPAGEYLFEMSVALAFGAFFLLIPGEGTYLLPLLPVLLVAIARWLPRRWVAAISIAMIAGALITVKLDQRRVMPGHLFEELLTRRADERDTRELLDRRPAAPTVFVVGRFMVLRLLATDPSLERTPVAWQAWHTPGVALRAPGRPLAFADQLTPAQADSLRGRGWVVVVLPYREI